MAKIKTHRGAAKRFRFSKRGKIRRKKAYARHIMTKKSQKRLRSLRKKATVLRGDRKHLRRLLPGHPVS